MIVARPLVVGADEIWRPQPPHAWGLRAAPLPRWPPAWALHPDFSSACLARRPQCSSSRQYPVLELLLQKRGAERPHCGRAARQQAEQPQTQQCAATLSHDAVLGQSSAPSTASNVQSEARPLTAAESFELQLLGEQAESLSAPDWAQVGPEDLEASGGGPALPLLLRPRRLEREESEWSVLSFSSLRTDLSVELSEALDASDDDERTCPRRSSGAGAATVPLGSGARQ